MKDGDPTRRDLWNAYNRVEAPMLVLESMDTWMYSSPTIRQTRGVATNQLAMVIGVLEAPVSAAVKAYVSNSNLGFGAYVGIGLDSTTTPTPGQTMSPRWVPMPGGFDVVWMLFRPEAADLRLLRGGDYRFPGRSGGSAASPSWAGGR